MKSFKMKTATVIAAAAILGLWASWAAGADTREKAPAFTLEDRDEKSFKISFPRERPLIISLADREGSEQIVSWAKPVRERFGERVEWIGVANLEEVPYLMRAVARRMMKKGDVLLLLDWEGNVSKRYRTKPKVANIVVIDQKGGVALRAEGTATDERLEGVFKALELMVENPDGRAPASDTGH